MSWRIEFDATARKELGKIDRSWQRRIVVQLEEIANLEDPRSRGAALSGNKSGLWRYRVGDYRVICQLQDNIMVVRVVNVGHRREVYE